MSDERARLRALAEQATPGPWFHGADPAADTIVHRDSGLALVDTGRSDDCSIARLCECANAEYIAALSPDVVLRLLDDVERAERERDRIELERARLFDMLGEKAREASDERARAERLEAALRSIYQYTDDTLSLRDDDGPHDYGWQRTAVIEARNRAGAALAEPAPGGQDAERDELQALCDRLSKLLNRTINALRGEPPPLTLWSFHDVAERAEQMRDALQHLEQAYSNRHSPQHRANALGIARAALAGRCVRIFIGEDAEREGGA